MKKGLGRLLELVAGKSRHTAATSDTHADITARAERTPGSSHFDSSPPRSRYSPSRSPARSRFDSSRSSISSPSVLETVEGVDIIHHVSTDLGPLGSLSPTGIAGTDHAMRVSSKACDFPVSPRSQTRSRMDSGSSLDSPRSSEYKSLTGRNTTRDAKSAGKARPGWKKYDSSQRLAVVGSQRLAGL